MATFFETQNYRLDIPYPPPIIIEAGSIRLVGIRARGVAKYVQSIKE